MSSSVRTPTRFHTRWLALPSVRVCRTMLLAALTACGGGGGDTTGPALVSRVDVSISTVTLNAIGGTQAVTATARDAKGATVATATITWSSDNPAIVSVSGAGSTGTITAVGAGATVVRVSAGTVGAEIPVRVLGVRSIQVNPASASIRTGDAQTLTATFDADAGVSQAVVWTSTSPAIATISSTTGVVTGISAGSTTVRATSVADPRVSATGNITVTPARGVSITPASASIATGGTQSLVATVAIENGLNASVSWRSSAASVATVTQAGLVTGVAFGTTTITAISVADTTLRATATINVVPVIRAVSAAPTTASIFIGNTQPFTATVTAEGNLATTVTWRSSNPATATVNATGVVTAVSLGSSTITALSTVDTTKRATATITVTPRPISVSIIQRLVGVNPGTNTTLTATVGADPGISTAVTWSSGTPSVATITQGGIIAGLTAGTTLVTATSQADPTKKDTVTVSVVPRLATSWSSSRLNGVMYDDMISVVAFNPTTAFAINSINGGATGGDIYAWNGVAWTKSVSGSTFNTQFLSVHGTSNTNVIAVGTNGVIVRWTGSSWATMASGSTRTLRSVWVESGNSAFAVGINGTALRLTGNTWETMTTGSTAQLNGVWANAGIAYAVGAAGAVLRFNGTAWVKQTVPFNDDLNAVGGVAGGNVTAVGNFGGALQFDGTTWSLVNSNSVLDNLYAIGGNNANGNRMYVGGDNGLYQLNGTTLTSASAPYPVTVFGVSVDASGNPWAAGQRGSIQRFTGSAWETLSFAPDLLDVWSTSASNSWAVGEYGYIYRWNGTTWSRQTTPSLANLYTVWAPSAIDAFAGGDNGTMLRWNGTAWSAMTFPSTARVFALWGASSSNVFAVTDAGELLRYNGTTWSLQTTAPGGATLLSLYGVSANEVYATGTGGLVMRYNGTAWSTFSAPDAVTTLFGIWMSGSNNILAVGADQNGSLGFSFAYNGTAWQSLDVGGAKALTSVWGASSFDLYGTGDNGALLRFNGTSWQSQSTGTTDLLWAVSGAPDAYGGAFAVGINTTVVAGSSSGAFRAAAMLSSASPDLNPSAAALHDRKASHAAATGAARRDRGIRGSLGARIATARAVGLQRALKRGRSE